MNYHKLFVLLLALSLDTASKAMLQAVRAGTNAKVQQLAVINPFFA